MILTFDKDPLYGKLEIDENLFAGQYGPRHVKTRALSDEEIADRIETPIGTERLHALVGKSDNIVIVVDDNTRHTPLKRILPVLLDLLSQAYVSDEQITFLIGLGTHRPMTANEILDKFGKDISKRYRIVNHNWSNPTELVSLGKCRLGFEIMVNRLAAEADTVIGIGSIVPHATVGFSGGGKIIMPGICGEATIEATHWKALDYPMESILGNSDNPIRQSIIDICRRINLKMIINTILFNTDDIYQIVAGDVDLAHQAGIRSCIEVYGVPVPGKTDIVIAEAFPTDIDLRQSIKAICSADLICRDHGVIILLADCPEGIAPQFPLFEKFGFSDPERIFESVERGMLKEKIMAYTLVAIGRIISGRVTSILVSPNIGKEKTELMGFKYAGNVREAVDIARALVGSDGKVIVLNKAGNILPVTDGKKY